MSHNFSEPEYEPENWSDPYIQGSHNCYAYFLDDQIKDVKKECQRVCDKGNKCRNNKKCGNLKPQPGHYCVDNEHKYADDFNIKDKLNIYNCPTILERVMCDNSLGNKELIKPVEFTTACPKDHYKGIVVIDSGQNRKMKNGHTYHFYRQDSNGRFSHKPGTLPVEDLDASNKPIYVPHLADTNYNKKNPMSKDGIHYDKRCSYMCIPRNYKKNTHAI